MSAGSAIPAMKCDYQPAELMRYDKRIIKFIIDKDSLVHRKKSQLFHTNRHFCSSWSITKPQKGQTRVLSCFLKMLKLTHFLHTGQKTFRFPEIFLIFTVSMN
jgi:hypothetical protein